jgi:hypothetical protein
MIFDPPSVEDFVALFFVAHVIAIHAWWRVVARTTRITVSLCMFTSGLLGIIYGLLLFSGPPAVIAGLAITFTAALASGMVFGERDRRWATACVLAQARVVAMPVRALRARTIGPPPAPPSMSGWQRCDHPLCRGDECEAADVNDHIPWHRQGRGCDGCQQPHHCQHEGACVFESLSKALLDDSIKIARVS